MAKKKKLIDLDDEVIKKLQIKAINSGHKNFKNYVEYVLTSVSKMKN